MNKVNHYRITKYNPALRDSKGSFLGSEWTSILDNVPFDSYLRVENRYSKSVLDCMALCGIKKVKITSIENHHPPFRLSRKINEINCRDWGAIDMLVRSALRAMLWFKLEGSRSFYVHFGYDYYMYLGGRFEVPEKKMNGLYVEPFKSPYLDLE